MSGEALCRVCGAPARDDAYLCDRCLDDLERTIGDLTGLIHEISVLATGQARVYRSGGKPAPAVEDPWQAEHDMPAWLRSPHGRVALTATRLPVNLAARDLLWAAQNTIGSWVRHLCESRGAPLPSGELVPWLLSNINVIRFESCAEQIVDEFTHLHRVLERAVDRAPSRLYAGPCHARTTEVVSTLTGGVLSLYVRPGRCQRDLYALPGSPRITCDGHRGDEIGCGYVHREVDRAGWLLDALEDALLPIDMWRAALPTLMPGLDWPSRSTWARWTDPDMSKHLSVRGVDRSGVETFRGGDVIAFATADQARIKAARTRGRKAG